MYKYKYTGRGVMSFFVEDGRYTVSGEGDTVELPIKVNIMGLELMKEEKEENVEKKEKSRTKKTKEVI